MKQREKRPYLKKILALLLVFSMLMPYLDLRVFAADPMEVRSVEYIKNHRRFDLESATLIIKGNHLSRDQIIIMGKKGAITNVKTSINIATYIEYQFTEEQAADFSGQLVIEGSTVDLGISNLPEFHSANNVKIAPTQKLRFKGLYLDKVPTSALPPNTKIYYGKAYPHPEFSGLNPVYQAGSGELEITASSLLGMHDIIVEKTNPSLGSGIATSAKYNYFNAFGIVESLNFNDIKMLPNAGAKGEMVTFESGKIENGVKYSAFFISPEDSIDDVLFGTTLSEEIKKRSAKSPINASGNLRKFSISVPNITNGTKKVVVVKYKGSEIVGFQELQQKFALISDNAKPTIKKVEPKEGSSEGANIQLLGDNILIPKLPSLTDIPRNKTSIQNSAIRKDAQGEFLEIDYKVAGLTYAPADTSQNVTSIKRTIKGIVANRVNFKNDANNGFSIDSVGDILELRTVRINDESLINLPQDVVLEIETQIVAGGQTYIFNQNAILSKGYTFYAPSVEPVIKKISPAMVATRKIGDDKYQLNVKKTGVAAEDMMYISIEGEKFLITKYNDVLTGEVNKINYPAIRILSSSEAFGDEHLEVLIDNNTKKVTVKHKDQTQNVYELPDFKVLDAKGKEVLPNEMGTRIVFALPKEVTFQALGQKSIRVTNPMRESSQAGFSKTEKDLLTVKQTDKYPIITSVNPNIVASDTKEEITLTGRNIDQNAKIYIDGLEVEGLKISADSTGGLIVAKFKNPLARATSSSTQLLVQNENGESATWDFYYINSQYPQPILKKLNPNYGVASTIVLIEGENFVARNPIVNHLNGIEAFKMIGSRVKFDGQDVNSYNKDTSGNIALAEFQSKEADLIRISKNKELSALELSDNAYGILLKTNQNDAKNYILYYDENRNIMLGDGANEKYIFSLEGTTIKATLENTTTTKTVEVTREGLRFTDNSLVLKMFTPFKASGGEITGNRVRVLDANRIAVTIPALSTITRVYDVTVENPDTKSDTLRKSFTYYPSARTKPQISTITPAKGSVSGGVSVEITGRDFEKGIRVFFDGIEVPQKDITLTFEKGVTSSSRMVVLVPKYKDIINEVTVPVTLINTDGGSASKMEGFTYVKPASSPKLTKLVLPKGITKGGEVVEIYGEDFRYFEPFSKADSDSISAQYEPGDRFTDLNSNSKWDDLTGLSLEDDPVDVLLEKTEFMKNGQKISYEGYEYYAASPILPKIYFGTELAKIVEFGNGYIKVITPANIKGRVDVKLINNDTGLSNALPFTYEDSKPEIKFITPDQGARIGGEKKVLLGSGFEDSQVLSYQNDDDGKNTPAGVKPYKVDPDVNVRVRFANITNKDVPIGQENDGRINANNATVTLEGGLVVQYNGRDKRIKFLLREGGEVYERTFYGYTGEDVFFPAGMLKNGANYYQPYGYFDSPSSVYNSKNDYELFRVYAKEGRLIVERGYAPQAKVSSSSEVVLSTPSYYDIGLVQVTLFNPDEAEAKSQFKYVNPATKPVIISTNPSKEVAANSLENPTPEVQLFVEGTIEGGSTVEIKGRDFRDGAKVLIGTKEAQVLEIIKNTDDTQTIIIKTPRGDAKEVDTKLPIIVKNEDGGTASSIDKNTLEGKKLLIYYVYRKPLSLPEIKEVVPNKTSQYGGNTIRINGKDFRKGVKVVLGAKGGVPILPKEIDRLGEFLTFVTPSNMPIGPHTIQILNPDFGLKEIPNGLTVISYPIIDSASADTKLDSGNVSVDGNDKVVLKGKNFMPGAKVFLGGDVYGITASTPLEAGAVLGFGKDDKEYGLRKATEAKEVKVIDANTIEFVTPEVSVQDKLTITVVNTDTGMSSSGVTLNFTLPIPNRPLSLKASVVDNKYIRLYDYKSNNHKYFDVYVYMGKKSLSDLRKDKYIDFKQLDNIDYEPYKITRLDGFDALKRSDRIVFVMKAVNQYGASDWSNLAYLNFDQFSKIKELGGSDVDGLKALGKEPSVDIKTQVVGNQLDITYPINSFRAQPYLYFKDSRYANINVVDFILSNRNVLLNEKTQKLQMELLDLEFVPKKLETAEIKALKITDNDRLKFNLDLQDNFDKSEKKSKLPRNIKPISPVVKVNASLLRDGGEVKLSQVGDSIKMSFHLTSRAIRKSGSKAYKVYYYSTNGSWKSVPFKMDQSAKRLDVDVKEYGYYVICE